MIFQSTFRRVFFKWLLSSLKMDIFFCQDKLMFVNTWFFWNGNLILLLPCLQFFWLYPFLGFSPLGLSSNAGAFLALKTFMISYIPFSFLPPVSSRSDLTYFERLPIELTILALFFLPEMLFFALLMANSSILSLDISTMILETLTPSQILLLWLSSLYSHKT